LKFLFRYLFLVLGCLHLVGGPHSLIQLYAWGNMLVEYSRDSTLAQAAEDTFSGKKPCSLCNKIAAVKSAEPEDNEGPLSPLTGKSFQDLFPSSVATLHGPFSTPFPEATFASPADLISPPRGGPPTPPPRC